MKKVVTANEVLQRTPNPVRTLGSLRAARCGGLRLSSAAFEVAWMVRQHDARRVKRPLQRLVGRQPVVHVVSLIWQYSRIRWLRASMKPIANCR